VTAKPISIEVRPVDPTGVRRRRSKLTSGDLLVEGVAECGVPDEATAGVERLLTPEQKSAEGIGGRASVSKARTVPARG